MMNEAIPKWYYDLNSKQRIEVTLLMQKGMANKVKYEMSCNPLKKLYYQLKSNYISYLIENIIKAKGRL